MADQFLLRFPLPGAPMDRAEWQSPASSGSAPTPVSGTLTEAATAIGGNRCVWLVPGENVLLAAPQLPTRGLRKLAQLVPYALEEQLASEIDAMHFALGRVGSDGALAVAAVDRDTLSGWLSRLTDAGIQPAAAYADSALIPENPSQCVLVLDGQRLLMRRPGQPPVTLDAEPLDTALGIAGLLTDALSEPTVETLLVYASRTDWDANATTLEMLRGRVARLTPQLLNDGVLPLLAMSLTALTPVNLLQGAFTPRYSVNGGLRQWRLPMSLVALTVFLHLAIVTIQMWQLHREDVRLAAQLRAVAAEALPDITHIERLANIRASIDSRLHTQRAAVNEGLVGMLSAMGGALESAPSITINSVNFHDHTAEVTVDAPDVASLDTLRAAARGHGFSADLLSATQKESRYQGRLRLSETAQ